MAILPVHPQLLTYYIDQSDNDDDKDFIFVRLRA